MKTRGAVCFYVLLLALVVYPTNYLLAAEPKLSEATMECIGCHASVTPGIVGDWRHSLHSKVTPKQALAKDMEPERYFNSSLLTDSI